VAWRYCPCESPFLRQGEIIEDVVELIPLLETSSINEGKIPVQKDPHKYSIVVSQGCDLEWDYRVRQGDQSVPEHKLLRHVLFCDLFAKDYVRDFSNLKSSELFGRVVGNQNIRFHHLAEASIGDTSETIPELIADFKSTFSLPCDYVYWLIDAGQSTRKGYMPAPYLQDFMQRLHSFLSRVALPD